MMPPDQMIALTAYQTAVALARAGTHAASLPYFRRALDLRPDLWQVQRDFAATEANAMIEVGSRRGRLVPLSRSSIERVAGIRDALGHLTVAERRATLPEDRADVAVTRARQYALWSLGWDAYESYQAAAEIAPEDTRIGSEASFHVRLLHDPVETGR